MDKMALLGLVNNKDQGEILKRFIFCCLLLGIHAYSAAAVPSDFNDKVSQILDNFRVASNITGAELSISLPGETSPRTFFSGTKTIEAKFPLHMGHLTQVASITKSFIAALVLKVAEEGRIGLDDTLGQWLPEYTPWSKITVRQLLNHTSGIYNFSDDQGFRHDIFFYPHKRFDKDALIKIALNKPLYHEPGEGFHYCNTGYLLIGKILEKATGQGVGELLHAHFFGQRHLNLDNSFFVEHLYPEALKHRMLHGYYALDDTHSLDITNYTMSWFGAAGGVVSNSYDIVHWLRSIFQNHVLSKESLHEFTSLISLKNGRFIEDVSEADPEAYGLGIKYSYLAIPGVERVWWHSGGAVGYKSLMMWLPNQQVSMVLAYDKVNKGEETHSISPYFEVSQALIKLVANTDSF